MLSWFSQSTASGVTLFSTDVPPGNWWRGHSSTMWCVVWTSPHSQSSESFRPHLCIICAQRLWLHRMRFSEVHVFRGRENPGSFMFGSTTRCLFFTSEVCHWIRHDSSGECRDNSRLSPLVQKGFLDVRRLAGWFARSSCSGMLLVRTFLYSLRVAVSRLTVGGAIFERTGSHCSGVEGSVPLTVRIAVFSCTSILLSIKCV